MRFFIDTAEFDEIKEAYDFGFIDGVNKEKARLAKAIQELEAYLLRHQFLRKS